MKAWSAFWGFFDTVLLFGIISVCFSLGFAEGLICAFLVIWVHQSYVLWRINTPEPKGEQ